MFKGVEPLLYRQELIEQINLLNKNKNEKKIIDIS